MVELSESPISSKQEVIADQSMAIEVSTPEKVKKIKKAKKSISDATPDKKKKKDKKLNKSVDESPPKKKKRIQIDLEEIKQEKIDNTLSVENENNVEEIVSKPDENSDESRGSFSNFRISQYTKELLVKQGIKYLFPIQIKTFDYVYDGEDVIAQARTGTGKTISFALPLVEKLLSSDVKRARGRAPQVLVMAPTRELAIQVHRDFELISQSLSSVCIYGGAPYYPQESAMRNGVDIVVGTPGRILDHLKKGNLRLGELKHVVLDEVDNMLDMGFAPIVEEILQYGYTQERESPPQTLLFSATCPSWVYKTASKYMRKERTMHVDTIGESMNRTATTVEHLAIRCLYQDRAGIIGGVVQMHSGMHGRAMIFTDTKKEANELVVCEALQQLKAQVLHGDIEQRQREITLKAYRSGTVKCLVATNVAARGLDIPEIDLVIQTSPPNDIESYIHRSGRTGRAGRTGVCVCFYKPREDVAIRRVEQTAGIKFKFVGPPQPKDIVKSSIDDAIKSLESVDKKVSEAFMDQAKLVADKLNGPLEALSAALAWISGAAKVQSRSLLSSQANYTTWQMRADFEVKFVGFVFSSLEKYLCKEIRDAARGMRLTADKKGAVFDLPNEFSDEVESTWHDSESLQLTKAEQLPPLLEDNRSSFRSNDRRNNSFRSNGFRSNTRGRTNNARGGSRGFRGGRGRGFKRSWGDR